MLLLTDLFTIATTWVRAGRPPSPFMHLGTFDAWSDTIGGALAHAGLKNFLGNFEKQLQDSCSDGMVSDH